MRITGGTLGGRKLNVPAGKNTRPTSDRVREALFGIILHHDWGDKIGNPLESSRILDAFAGTGALGIESLSHGANQCIFFEKDRNTLKVLRENVSLLNQREKSKILPIDATHPPKTDQPCSLVFLDPPYHKKLIPKALEALNKARWIMPNALIVAETARDETIEFPSTLCLLLERIYGDTCIRFLGKRGL